MDYLKNVNIGKEKYPALTGIRALCATVVFFNHFHFSEDSPISVNVMPLFFILSGFLIFKIYYQEFEFNKKYLFKYFVNRYARIYPVYFLLLTIAVFIYGHYEIKLLVKNYTLTHALFHNTKDFIIEPSWSLTVEECFYLFAPFFMMVLRARGFITLLFIGFLLLIVALFVSTLNISFLETSVFVLSTTFFGHFFEFFSGIMLSIIVNKREQSSFKENSKLNYTFLGGVFTLLILVLISYLYSYHSDSVYTIIFLGNFLIAIPISIFFYGLITESSFVSKILSCRLARIMGRGSYSFYLLHTLFIYQISIPILENYNLNRGFIVIVTFLIVYIISIAIYFFYEEPLNLFIRKRFVIK